MRTCQRHYQAVILIFQIEYQAPPDEKRNKDYTFFRVGAVGPMKMVKLYILVFIIENG